MTRFLDVSELSGFSAVGSLLAQRPRRGLCCGECLPSTLGTGGEARVAAGYSLKLSGGERQGTLATSSLSVSSES